MLQEREDKMSEEQQAVALDLTHLLGERDIMGENVAIFNRPDVAGLFYKHLRN